MPPLITPDVQAFLQRAERALGPLATPTDVYAFDDTPPVQDELAALALAGIKTATCNWPTEVSYKRGDLAVLLDGSGRPVALLRTTELRTVPFLEVDAQFAYDEGENDRSLEAWRAAHRNYFGRKQAERPFTEQELVLCERFEVLYQEKSANMT